jgi:non-ribosomal peptide synthase protein (TIGR01720 family)
VAVEAEPGSADGTEDGVGGVPVTPIAHRLAERGGPIGRFTQSHVLRVPAGLAEGRLVEALQAVLDRHDALRMRLQAGGDGWRLEITEPGSVPASACLRRVNVSELDDHAYRASVRAEGDAARARIRPENGIMVQAVWFDRGLMRPGRLLIVAHHLVVDGVSWRILLPDLAEAYGALAGGRSARVPPVGTSFRRWAQLLADEARSPAREAEVAWWTRTLDVTEPAVGGRALDHQRDTHATAGRMRLVLPVRTTEAVLTTVPALFQTGVEDVLVAAFAMAATRWRQRRFGPNAGDLLVDLEGHGRDDILAGPVDLSRTVGWFTNVCPVRLDVGAFPHADAWSGGPAVGRLLKRVKERLRAIAGGRLGYGMLRYLNPDTSAVLRGLPRPQFGFNYLGRFMVDQPADWAMEAGVDAGPEQDPAMPLAHVVELDAATADRAEGPELVAGWTWARNLVDEADLRELAQDWFRALEAIVEYARRPDAGGLTPSDVALSSIDQAEIEQFETDLNGG